MKLLSSFSHPFVLSYLYVQSTKKDILKNIGNQTMKSSFTSIVNGSLSASILLYYERDSFKKKKWKHI